MPDLTYSAGDRVRVATYTVAGLGGLTGEVLKSEINAFGVEEVTISVVEAPGRQPSRCSFAANELERLPFDPLNGASRGVGRCTCPCGRGTNPACPVHP